MQITNENGTVEVDDGMYCSIAVDEALNSLCPGSESAFREVATTFFGFTQEDLGRLFPIETRYREILDDGLIDGQCMDYAEIRMYVLALAWSKMKDDETTPRVAIQSAWTDARMMCEEFGVRL